MNSPSASAARNTVTSPSFGEKQEELNRCELQLMALEGKMQERALTQMHLVDLQLLVKNDNAIQQVTEEEALSGIQLKIPALANPPVSNADAEAAFKALDKMKRWQARQAYVKREVELYSSLHRLSPNEEKSLAEYQVEFEQNKVGMEKLQSKLQAHLDVQRQRKEWLKQCKAASTEQLMRKVAELNDVAASQRLDSEFRLTDGEGRLNALTHAIRQNEITDSDLKWRFSQLKSDIRALGQDIKLQHEQPRLGPGSQSISNRMKALKSSINAVAAILNPAVGPD